MYDWKKEIDRMTADMTDTANDCFWCSREANVNVDPEIYFSEVMRQFQSKMDDLKRHILDDVEE